MPKPIYLASRHHLYVGIDPGVSGGIAVLDHSSVYLLRSMPETEQDVWTCISNLVGEVFPITAMIEKVGGYIQGASAPGSAMFNFGHGYGGLRMALIAAGIPFDNVTPQKWQKEFSMNRDKTETTTVWKNRLKAKAQQLFPAEKITLATADALLIAEYCRRVTNRNNGAG